MRNTNLNVKIEGNLPYTKSYALYETAVKTAVKEVTIYAEQYNNKERVIDNMDYVIVYLPEIQRWTPVFLCQRFMQKGLHEGGFIGHFALRGFMQI